MYTYVYVFSSRNKMSLNRNDNNRSLPELSFVKEMTVNVNIAVFVIIFGILGLALSLVPIVGAVFSVLAGALQIVVMYQWTEALNTNIENSLKILAFAMDDNATESTPGNLRMYTNQLQNSRIDMLWFWLHLAFYIISGVIINALFATLASIMAFIFLGIFLQSIFNTEERLQGAKDLFYGIYLHGDNIAMRRIKKRHFGLVILFTIITLGIYWWFLLINHSREINDFIEADVYNRSLLKK